MDVRAIQILLDSVKEKRREIYNVDMALRWSGPFLLACTREDIEDNVLVKLEDRETIVPLLVDQRGKCQSALTILEEELRKLIGIVYINREEEI